MKLNLTLFTFLVLTTICSSQKYDYTWLLGYDYSLKAGDTFGISVLNFNTSSLNPQIYFDSTMRIDFNGACTSISDYNGNFIFATNSSKVIDKTGKVMKNGQDIDPSVENWSNLIPQTNLILPDRKNAEIFYLLNESIILVNETVGSTPLLFNKIYFNSENGKYFIDGKYKLFNTDTLQTSGLIGIKHSNGDNWWVIKPALKKSLLYEFILVDSSIQLYKRQLLDTPLNHSYSFVNSSPNGRYYIKISTTSDTLPTVIDLLQIDRCSGKTKFLKKIPINNSSYFIGVCFSPNSKLLYVSGLNSLYQIDMSDSTYTLNEVAKRDKYIEDQGGGFRSYNYFGGMQLGPDGRIYGIMNRFSRKMFVIDRPNVKGMGCNVKQHYISLPSLQQAIPYFPNYRLGPEDGSPCDTLGIDNIPVAEFRYDQDTINYKQFEFTNLSWYEPTEFWWDYGDGSPVYYTTVWDTSITHIFPKNGLYNVCLRAKNTNGENTICKTLKIGSTGSKEINIENEFEVFPNPTKDLLVINLKEYLPENMSYNIYNINGESVSKGRMFANSNLIDLEKFNADTYFLTISENGKIVYTSKVIKL